MHGPATGRSEFAASNDDPGHGGCKGRRGRRNFVVMSNKTAAFVRNPKLFLQTCRFSSPELLRDNELQ